MKILKILPTFLLLIFLPGCGSGDIIIYEDQNYQGFSTVVHVTLYQGYDDDDYISITDRSVEPILLALEHATPETVVYIKLFSPGGHLSSMYGVIIAMEKSKAGLIVVEVDREVSSAAAILAFVADKVVLDTDDELMFHMPKERGASYRFSPIKGDPLERRAAKVYLRVLEMCCNNLFSKEEAVDLIYGGEDIWLTGQDIRFRIDKKRLAEEFVPART